MTPTPKDNELTLQSFKTPLRYVIVGAYKFVNVEDVHKLLANEVDQYTQSKLKAFAGELEEAIGEDVPTPRPEPDFLLGDVYGVEANELRAELRQALKAIKEKYQL